VDERANAEVAICERRIQGAGRWDCPCQDPALQSEQGENWQGGDERLCVVETKKHQGGRPIKRIFGAETKGEEEQADKSASGDVRWSGGA
jgi:hypothetical protein